MSSYSNEIIRDVRRDLARKARLQRAVSPLLAFATDAEAEKVEEMSASEFASKCLAELKKRGIITNSNAKDPVEALEAYLAGTQKHKDERLERLGVKGAQDSATQSAVDRYLAE